MTTAAAKSKPAPAVAVHVNMATEAQVNWLAARAKCYTTSTLDLLFDIKSIERYKPSTDALYGYPILEEMIEDGFMLSFDKKAGKYKCERIEGGGITGLGKSPLMAAVRALIIRDMAAVVSIPGDLA